jgi:hypothetical protein
MSLGNGKWEGYGTRKERETVVMTSDRATEGREGDFQVQGYEDTYGTNPGEEGKARRGRAWERFLMAPRRRGVSSKEEETPQTTGR